MNVTDEQLLDFRQAAKRHDNVTATQILEAIRAQNPSEYRTLSDADLRRTVLLRVARLLSES